MQDAALDFENREEVNIASILTMSGLSKDEAADCANFPRLCEKCGLEQMFELWEFKKLANPRK